MSDAIGFLAPLSRPDICGVILRRRGRRGMIARGGNLATPERETADLTGSVAITRFIEVVAEDDEA